MGIAESANPIRVTSAISQSSLPYLESDARHIRHAVFTEELSLHLIYGEDSQKDKHEVRPWKQNGAACQTD